MTVPAIGLTIAAGFVLYPLLVGVSYRFLGKEDRLGAVRWFGRSPCCPKCNGLLGEFKYCRNCEKHRRVHDWKLVDDKKWGFAIFWPITWTLVLLRYIFHYALWTPVKLMALATSKTAQLTAGHNEDTHPLR
jgi:hypothetical protein